MKRVRLQSTKEVKHISLEVVSMEMFDDAFATGLEKKRLLVHFLLI